MAIQKNSMPGDVHGSNQHPVLVAESQSALFLLTYNPKGAPVPFIGQAAYINLFV